MSAREAARLPPRGLALLCGWTGGKLRSLKKHEAVWHRLGWSTVSTPVSIDETFFRPEKSGLSAVARDLVTAVEAHRAARSDALVISHTFSNGGAMLMLEMLREHGRRDVPNRRPLLDGAVYDSAPSNEIHPWQAPIVILSAGLPRAQTAWELVKHTPHALASQAVGMVAGSYPGPLGAYLSDLRDAQLNTPRPELCIYSDGDVLIPASAIEKYVSYRSEACGADTKGCFLRGSAHVAHYRAHPREYEAAIEELVERVGGTGAVSPPTCQPHSRL